MWDWERRKKTSNVDVSDATVHYLQKQTSTIWTFPTDSKDCKIFYKIWKKKRSQIHTFSTKAKSNLIQACAGRWTSSCYYLQLHQIFKAYYIFLPRKAEPVIHIGTCVYVSMKQHFNGVQPTFGVKWTTLASFVRAFIWT